LTQKQICCRVVRRYRIAISACELNLAIDAAQHTRRSKKIHGCIRDPLLDKLHVQNRLTIRDQRAINGKIKMPDQPAELPRLRAKLFALHGHVRHKNRRLRRFFPAAHALFIPSRDGFIIVS
jgi:hypothetical protein